MTSIQLQNVSKIYRKHTVLNNISFDIPNGMIGLLGPNGAGKTTLIRLLTGFLKPHSGTIRVAGNDIQSDAQLYAVRDMLGYVPQHVSFYPNWTVYEFVDYIARLKGLHKNQARHAVVETCLEKVGLLEQQTKKTTHLSGGMARRLAIAQAIVNDPAILIIDEPTAGLDPQERMRFRHLLSTLGANRTVLFSTHIVDDIEQTCDYIIILDRVLLYAGTVAHLLELTDKAQVVWDVVGPEPLEDRPDWTVVRYTPKAAQHRYRIVSKEQPTSNAVLAPSNLEEGYAWIIQKHNTMHLE